MNLSQTASRRPTEIIERLTMTISITTSTTTQWSMPVGGGKSRHPRGKLDVALSQPKEWRGQLEEVLLVGPALLLFA